MAEKKQRATKKFAKKQNCPKCGPGTSLGTHSNRVACGKCGYTEMKQKG